MKKQEYILRYYLPIKPYFDEEYTEKRFQELLAFCKATDTKAVMFYVALSPDFYYMPDSVEYAKQARTQMLPYIQRIKAAGISYQLNFQNLVGSTLGGVDFSSQYDWEFLVDYKGRTSCGCGCPLGKKFREHSAKRLQIWAETDPDIIWIDDDLRLHNHGTPQLAMRDDGAAPYMDYYCFCDEHIRLFNERYQTHYDREKLVGEILQTGKPSWAREHYLDFLNDTIVDTAAWIEKTVHKVNPRVRLAQMTSYPDVHAAEGRKWEEFLPALCGEYTPVVRAHFGPYMESNPREFVDCYCKLNQTIEQIGAYYKKDVEYAPEVENTRFTVWAKSAAATSYQLALSAFMGCSSITLSLYDLDGGAFFDEPKYREMLIQQKQFLDKVVGLNLKTAKTIGVKILTSPDSGRRYALKAGEGYEPLSGSKRYIEKYLLTIGIPCAYTTDEKVNADGVTALDSFTANYVSDEQLKTLFQGALFLDAGAAEVLIERGFGEYIGVKQGEKQPCIVNAEVIKTFTRKDGTYIRIPSRIPIHGWYAFEYDKNVTVCSEFLTPDGRVFPAMTTFTNALGGKVAIYPAYENWGDGFFNHHRARFFKDVFAQLCPSLPRVDVEGAMLSAVKETLEGERYYLCANLAPDTTQTLVINGKKVREKLRLYQTAVYCEKNGKVKKLGKTR
ncbi:MAG: hypothetical protein J6A63_10690 [Clostridia bacterium]|nr:hypothetical protein [Clostridia bacterium]